MCAEAAGGIMDFCSVYGFFAGVVPGGMDWLAFALAAGTLSFIVINSVVAATALYTWFERRGIGRFQNRLGPNRWGPFGLLQPLADVLKLISKEEHYPGRRRSPGFHGCPDRVRRSQPFSSFAVIPFGEHSFLGGLNVGCGCSSSALRR